MYQQPVGMNPVAKVFISTFLVSISLIGCGKKDAAKSDQESVNYSELYDSIRSADQLKSMIDENPSILTAKIGQHTFLNRAARDCKADWVQVLIDAGADLEAVDVQGRTPLHNAVNFAYSAPAEDRLETMRVLLEAGADPNAFSWRGTPTGRMRSDYVFGSYGIEDDRFYQPLVDAGGDPDGYPESIETVILRVGMPYREALEYLQAGEYKQIDFFNGLVDQADWSELDRPRLMNQEQFYHLHYGGLLYLEPTNPALVSDKPELGRLLVWHPFYRNGPAAQPVDVDMFEISVDSPEKLSRYFIESFEYE